jgi:hypothetical protein
MRRIVRTGADELFAGPMRGGVPTIRAEWISRKYA